MNPTFSSFQDEFLVATYDLSERTGQELVETGEIFAKYPISRRPNWIVRALLDFANRGLIQQTLTHNDELSQSVWLTAAGMREAERLMQSGVVLFSADDFGDTTSDVPTATEFDTILARVVPASDRLVTLGDNSEFSQSLLNGVDHITEKIKASNSLPVDEKSDVIESLSVFQALVRRSKTLMVGAFRYLVLERVKKAFEKIIEDALRLAILAILASLAITILAVL